MKWFKLSKQKIIRNPFHLRTSFGMLVDGSMSKACIFCRVPGGIMKWLNLKE